MDAKQALKDFKREFDPLLERVLEEEIERSHKQDPQIHKLLERIKSVALGGGKRLRPALIFYSFKLFGGENRKEVMKLGVFYELVHLFLLIHDDIMDNADMRRGRPTLNKIYTNQYKTLSEHPKHTGNSISIVAGDIVNFLSLKVLSESEFEAEKLIKVLKFFSVELMDLGYGQITEFTSPYQEKLNEEDILKFMYQKSGNYSVETPMSIGAVLAGAKETDLNQITELAIPAGTAFQLQDDILGIFGKDIGKSTSSDLKEGKSTLLTLKVLENAKGEDLEFFKQNLGNREMSQKEIGRMKEIVVEAGALKYSQDKLEKLLTQAVDVLESNQNWDQEAKKFFHGLLKYLEKRKI